MTHELSGTTSRWSYADAVRHLLSMINYEALAGGRIPPPTSADLKRFSRALGRLGHPERCAPAVHIAGTNGKGSTAAMTAALLTGLGFRTGLYTSPHLEDMRERIRVDGAPVGKAEFAAAARTAAAFIGAEPGSGFRTTFELLTAMAFIIFRKREVDAMVIEVGLGGRLDSTNVILPRVAVIASISLDHVETLGPDVAAIAADKAHILKRGTRAVTVDQPASALAALRSRARKVGVTLETTGSFDVRDARPSPKGERFSLATPDGVYENVVTALKGSHQVENAVLAIRAVELFTGRGMDPAIVRPALARTRWPGRFEVLAERPPLVIDGAHNPGGAGQLVASLDRYFPGQPVVFVAGISKGKDGDAILEVLGPRAAALIATTADHPRAEEADVVARAARRFVKGPVETARDERSALIRARHLAAGGVVCVAGSLYLIGDVRRLWGALRASWSGSLPRGRRARTRRVTAPETVSAGVPAGRRRKSGGG